MKFLNLALKNKEKYPTSFDDLYDAMIVRKIRTKYTVNQELAIIRQKDTKPQEFAEYNSFVERCKIEIKKELGR